MPCKEYTPCGICTVKCPEPYPAERSAGTDGVGITLSPNRASEDRPDGARYR